MIGSGTRGDESGRRPPRAPGKRAGLWLGLVALVCAACTTLPSPPPAPVVPGGLILLQSEPTSTGPLAGRSLHAIDRDTLLDLPETPPLPAEPCSTVPVFDRQERFGAIVDNGVSLGAPPCLAGSALRLHVLDVAAWTLGPAVDLAAPADRTLELAWTPSTGAPLVWSADGRRLYVFTISHVRDWAAGGRDPDETRQLWIIDPSAANPPQAVDLDVAVWRATLAPSGASLDVLGYRTRGPSRYGTFEPGSAVLARLDPATGAVRARVPLPGVTLANVAESPAGSLPASYDPGVAISPNGRYYLVAHADQPILDVVDVFAPGLERLERSIITEPGPNAEAANAAWLAVSPDGRHVFTRRLRWTPDSRSGLPLQVIDLATWAVSTFDPAAAFLAFGPNDGRTYVIDDGGSLPGPAGGPPDLWNAPGAGLHVLDAAAAGGATTLVQDRSPLQVVPSGSGRLYVVLPGPEWSALEAVQRMAGPNDRVTELVAYDTATWREVARRPWHAPLWLASRH